MDILKFSNAGGFKNYTRYNDMLAGNTVWNPYSPTGSYDSLATVTLSATASSVTFSNIPTTYTHLQLRATHTFSASGLGINMQVGNGTIDTGSNYAYHYLLGQGTAASSGAASTQASWVYYYVVGNGSTAIPETEIWDFVDYSNTNKYKTSRLLAGVDNNGSGEVFMASDLWMNTSAINTIKINTSSSTFAAGSSFALYGVKA